MSSDIIQIVSPPNLQKIESFLNNSSYQETIEFSANFNTRLCIERRLRLPFLETQTGVAQTNCSLFMSRRQRMPGFKAGQIYTYPSLRWRKSRRQYLSKMIHPFPAVTTATSFQSPTPLFQANGIYLAPSVPPVTVPPVSNNGGVGGLGSTSGGFLVSAHDENSNSNASLEKVDPVDFETESNSRDTNNNSKMEELSRDWLYDDLDNDFDNVSEPKSADDEYDYDPRYGNKKRAKKPMKKEAKSSKKSNTNNNSDTNTAAQCSSSSGSSKPKKRESSSKRDSDSRTRGRKKASGGGSAKKNSSQYEDPPSFESAAAMNIDSVELMASSNSNGFDSQPSYRKYL